MQSDSLFFPSLLFLSLHVPTSSVTTGQRNGLTEDELKEQQILRREYIDSFRRNLKSQLDNISIIEADGSITDLGEKFGKKKGN